MRSVPQNFKLAYLDGWYEAKKAKPAPPAATGAKGGGKESGVNLSSKIWNDESLALLEATKKEYQKRESYGGPESEREKFNKQFLVTMVQNRLKMGTQSAINFVDAMIAGKPSLIQDLMDGKDISGPKATEASIPNSTMLGLGYEKSGRTWKQPTPPPPAATGATAQKMPWESGGEFPTKLADVEGYKIERLGSGKGTLSYTLTPKGGKNDIGQVTLTQVDPGQNLYQVFTSSLDKAHRGRGLVQRVLQQLSDSGVELVSSDHASPSAVKMWKRMGAEFDGKLYRLKTTKPAPPAATGAKGGGKEIQASLEAEVERGKRGIGVVVNDPVQIGTYGMLKKVGDDAYQVTSPGGSQVITFGSEKVESIKNGVITIKGYKPKQPTPPPPAAPGAMGQGPGAQTAPTVTRTAPAETLEATGLKHAIDEMERRIFGFKERSPQEKQNMAEAWDRAGKTLAKDPTSGERLAQEIINNPQRALSGDESALLLRHKVTLENAMNDAAERTFTGADANTKAVARADIARYRDELNQLLDAVATRGSEWGREGRWRQALAYEDFSFATQERLLTAAKGRPLETAEIETLRKQLAEYKKKFEELETFNAEKDGKAVEIAVKEALDRVEKEAASKPRYHPRVIEVAESFAKYMDKRAEVARVRLAEKLSRLSSGVDPTIVTDLAEIGVAKLTRGLVDKAKWIDSMLADFGPKAKDYLSDAWDAANKLLEQELARLEGRVGRPLGAQVRKKVSEPTAAQSTQNLAGKISKKMESGELGDITNLVQKLARAFVEDGVRERNALIDAVHGVLQEVIPGITRRETMDAISGYGKYKQLKKDEISLVLRDLKGQMQQIGKLEDMASGKAPQKTGMERRTRSDEERALVKQVEEAKRRGGYKITDPATQLRTSLQAAKTAVEHQIADLEREILTRERIVKTKTPLVPDQQLLDLRAKRDALKEQHKAIFGDRTLSEAQKIKMAEASLDRQIADIQDQLRTGEIFPPGKLEKAPLSSPGITAKLQTLAELKLRRYYERQRIQPRPETDPLASALQSVKTRLQNQITDLEKQISTREKIVKEKTRLQYDDEANRLKARRDELKQQFDEIFQKPELTDAQRLQLWKERTTKRIADYQEKLRTGDFAVKKRRPPPQLDMQGRKLQAALDEVKQQIQHERDRAEWEAMSVFQKTRRGATDAYDAARMLMTTGEFSFILRQGKLTFLSRPWLTAKALPGMFRAMRSWEKAHAEDLKIFEDPDYPASKKATLHIVNESASLTRMEEIWAGRWAHAIPGIAHFNRAARVFLNKIRFDTWKAMRKSLGRNGITTPAEDLAIATFVNESTGRANIGFAEQAAVPLGRLFFAPRYTISRFQLLAGHSLWKGSWRSRRVIAQEYVRVLIGLGLYYTLLNAMFSGSKDKKAVNLDPRSSDFGKVRIGDTRIDPLAGMAQAATFIGRTVTGKTVTTRGRVINLREPDWAIFKHRNYGDPRWTDIAARFGRSKLHPVPATLANLFEGTTMDGAETSLVKETGNLVGPITYFDILRAFQEQDVPEATAMSLMAILGEGLQTYQPKKK
jgi:hypothetical protein